MMRYRRLALTICVPLRSRYWWTRAFIAAPAHTVTPRPRRVVFPNEET